MNSTETAPTLDLNAALLVAIRAARLGREVLLKYHGRLEHIEEKFQAGLVSEADRESEKAIFDYLKKNFPNDEFIGEESTSDEALTKVREENALADRPSARRWIVDPLDGTTNYVHRFPVYCISIGYEVNGEVELAVIDVPHLGEIYTAIRGKGAFVNGKPLKVSTSKDLHESLLATGFIGDREHILQEQLRIFSKVVRQCRGIRRAGAAAYDLCMVARGVFDGYWERGLSPWDSAAGILLVREAGGIVTTYRGQKYNPFHKSLVAGSPLIHKQLLQEFAGLMADEAD
jgi:myo-inositol-1(or 4)-monophosphatase